MQDIDFDELDRAVSSAINPGSKTPAPEKPAEEKPAAEVEKAPEVPKFEVPERGEQVRPPVSPAARRSSGRFMDVVHPSSDMRGATPARPAEVKPAPTPEPVETPKPVVEANPSVEEALGDNFTWPDPLELEGNKVAEPAPAPAPTPVEAEAVDSTPQGPLETPFLSDTKVEKRPLGAFSDNAAPMVDLAAALNDEDISSSEPVDLPDSLATDVDLDVIEATKIEDKEETAEPDVAPGVVSVNAETPKEEVKSVEAAPAASFDPPASTPLGAASIPQQYTEQPSTTDQPSGAIYDTEAYHQPLAHPQKKKSGVFVIFWILGLLALGGALGAALYFYVLPML